MPTTLHYAGNVDSSGNDYLIDGRNVLAEAEAEFENSACLRVFHDGAEVCAGKPSITVGQSCGTSISVFPVFDVGDYDLIGILDDADGFPIDLTITDDPEYGV